MSWGENLILLWCKSLWLLKPKIQAIFTMSIIIGCQKFAKVSHHHLASQGLSNSELPCACKKSIVSNKDCVSFRTFSRSWQHGMICPYISFWSNRTHIMNLDLHTAHAHMDMVIDMTNHWLKDNFHDHNNLQFSCSNLCSKCKLWQ